MSNGLRRVVLDSFAVMALLKEERSAPVVHDLISRAGAETDLHMCTVNVGEVLYKTSRAYGHEYAMTALQGVLALPITLHDADLGLTIAAAEVKAAARMSYADSYAVALASRLDAEVATGDPEFRPVQHLVRLLWLER